MSVLLLWIVRLIVLILIIRFVVRMFSGALGRRAGVPRQPKRPPERIGGTLVQDPQCGTYLPQDRAITVVKGGSTAYFCSAKCRDEWASRS